jgi:hypothetical protein
MSVEDLIENSFRELKRIDFENQSPQNDGSSRLIFPQYWVKKNKKRVSEQEARFLFVKQLEMNKCCHDYYYAVEAPTKRAYQFSQNNAAIWPLIDAGQSANIDVCLYDKSATKFDRKNLIEFKFGNSNAMDYAKDFLKLLCDESGLTNYFINIVDVVNLAQRNTLQSITGKYQQAIGYVSGIGVQSTLIIFLYNINENSFFKFNAINAINAGNNTLNCTPHLL